MKTTKKEKRDLKVLALFTRIYCQNHHQQMPKTPTHLAIPGIKAAQYCADCNEFLTYASERRSRCPLDPKPTCKHCHIHCYLPGHREKVREIMRFSGKKLIWRGRLDLLWHYFF